jgi:hypothetical protein
MREIIFGFLISNFAGPIGLGLHGKAEIYRFTLIEYINQMAKRLVTNGSGIFEAGGTSGPPLA